MVLAGVTKVANEWFLTVYDLPCYMFLNITSHFLNQSEIKTNCAYHIMLLACVFPGLSSATKMILVRDLISLFIGRAKSDWPGQ